jgi:hypothetical protein
VQLVGRSRKEVASQLFFGTMPGKAAKASQKLNNTDKKIASI